MLRANYISSWFKRHNLEAYDMSWLACCRRSAGGLGCATVGFRVFDGASLEVSKCQVCRGLVLRANSAWVTLTLVEFLNLDRVLRDQGRRAARPTGQELCS